jgi:SAM-dependent methyltransferase
MPQESSYGAGKAQAFADRLLTTLNDGALCLMISIGHRTSLFDAMRSSAPATSADIAAKAGLNERYVREWLGAMVTGSIVDVDAATNRFSLPPEHSAFLTRAAGADNIGVFSQYIALLGGVEDDIVECFKKGGGVPYTRFPRIVADLSHFDDTAEAEAFDLIATFDAIHDQARPLNVLRGIHRALRADGIYLMQDIKGSSHIHNNLDHPLGPLLYTISCMHCMTVSLAQDGEGLGAMWGEEKTREYLAKAGFRSVEKNELAHDIQNNWYVVRK